MTNDQMHELARVGARARLQAIESERSAILQVFPNLASRSTSASGNSAPLPAGRKRGGMSPARRKAVSQRMKAYWAKRQAEKTGTQTESASKAVPTVPKPAATRKGMSPGRKAQAAKMRAYWDARRAAKAGAERSSGGSSKARKGRKAGRKK